MVLPETPIAFEMDATVIVASESISSRTLLAPEDNPTGELSREFSCELSCELSCEAPTIVVTFPESIAPPFPAAEFRFGNVTVKKPIAE